LIELDAHHITDRSIMPNGGYVAENGIAVCDECHESAEAWWKDGKGPSGFSRDDLYEKIGSSLSAAETASEALSEGTSYD